VTWRTHCWPSLSPCWPSHLTHLWWLYFLALVPTVFGVVMGLAGLTGWSIHPAVLIQLLS